MRYDPDEGPVDRAAWLALDEGARIALIAQWHREAGIEPPSMNGHAALHAAVENQLALGDPPDIRATLARLIADDGLDRHDAIHAIAWVLALLMRDLVENRLSTADFSARYAAGLDKLTAASWRSSMD